MTEEEKQTFMRLIMSENGRKGGASRAKTTTKAQRIAWGKKGAQVRYAKKSA